jgi:enamine deaminase RidA (YjgF/YER057c/UK114 family)
MTNNAEECLKGLGITLPDVATPAGNYVPWVRTGNLLFLAGQVSRTENGEPLVGKLGDTMGVEEGYEAAKSCGLRILATVRAALNTLDNVGRVVRVFGMVNCTPDFVQHPQVMNGCSDLLVAVLGEQGRHARCAVGHSSLPAGAAVEIEAIFEVAG